MRPLIRYVFTGLLALTLSILIVFAAYADQKPQKKDSYVTLSGTVIKVKEDSFLLNYGDSAITVDTEGYFEHLYKRNEVNTKTPALEEGDKVVVTGKVTDAWFSERLLNAIALIHAKHGRIFSYDRGNPTVLSSSDIKQLLAEPGLLKLTGPIIEIFSEDSLSLHYRGKKHLNDTINIDIQALPLNKRIALQPGDSVTLSGRLEESLFKDHLFKAETLDVKETAR